MDGSDDAPQTAREPSAPPCSRGRYASQEGTCSVRNITAHIYRFVTTGAPPGRVRYISLDDVTLSMCREYVSDPRVTRPHIHRWSLSSLLFSRRRHSLRSARRIARYKETPARRDDARRLDLDAQDRSRTVRVYAYHDLSALFPSKTSAL